jgi:2-polyprenyl-3-methyl-5-hydroxy-6-metoxy-1,4-benzoquinol methylase
MQAPNGDAPKNHWPWLRRWDARAQQAVDWACAQFPAGLRQRGLARSYYEFLWIADELLRLLPHPLTGSRILDAGCGAGVIPLALSRLGALVTAVDRFDEYGDGLDNQMGTAAEIVARLARNGICVERRDLIQDGLPGEPGAYDAITCFAVIEHLAESPRRILEAMYRLLKPGGCVVLTTPNHGWLRTRLRLLAGRSAHDPLADWWSPAFYGHVREYTLDELRQMLAWSGFEVQRAVASNWVHASSRLRRRGPAEPEAWTTRFTLDSPQRWLVAGSLLVSAFAPSLRYSLLAVGRKRSPDGGTFQEGTCAGASVTA